MERTYGVQRKKEIPKLKKFNQHKKEYAGQVIGNKHSLTEENIILALELISKL